MDLLPRDIQIIVYLLIHYNKLKNLNNEYSDKFGRCWSDFDQYFLNNHDKMAMYRKNKYTNEYN